MRQNNLKMWKYDSSLNCLLFFAQRMDELLFHHTTDTYRYSTLSIRGLASEYCRVYNDVLTGTLNRKNLDYIIEELSQRIKSDDIAETILTEEFIKRFIKHYASWDIKTQYENVLFIGRKLSNRNYYNHLVAKLRDLVIENKQKKEIDVKTSLFVRELLDCGYDENYVYHQLHEIFFHREVSSIDTLDEFLSKFDFQTKKYDVYIGYSRDLSSLLPLYQNLKITDLQVSLVDISAAPKGIKTKRQKTILKFENIESLDIYTAFEMADAISSCVVNSYSFFRHDPTAIKTYGQVVDGNGIITTIKPQKLLKNRVSVLSREASTKSAERLIKVFFANYDNLSSFSKITTIHNAAICSESTNDSLLSLWSILESVVEEDKNPEEKKAENNDDKKERSKIGNVISYTLPYLKSTYIPKLVQTCMLDIIRWDKDFFDKNIANNGFGENDLEHTFAFLAFKSMQSSRDALFAKTEMFPLLRYRVCTLSDLLQNSKGIKSTINSHTQRVEWHLHRIYRARNYIIHDAVANDQLIQELVINLHSYVDILFSEVINLIDKSPYNDSVRDAITGHKLSVLIMDEKLENRKNEDVAEECALQYLYYDFER